MANIMNLTKVSNKPSRNGFDLSQKINFTAKVGELLPVWWTPVIPGDNIKINLQNFIRTQSLNSAAFARMRGYYDFYFVPYRLLWDKFDTAITQMQTNLQVASGPVMSANKPLTGQLPYFTCEQVANYLESLAQSESNTDAFGFDRAVQTSRLLNMLGYGDFSIYTTGGTTYGATPMVNNLSLSPFPLLAYQKIYADYNRYTQWERTNPSTFNLNYIKGNGDLQLDLSVNGFTSSFNFFDIRYSNWQKDLFHGVLPVAQYGEASVIPVSGSTQVLPDGTPTFSFDSPVTTDFAKLAIDTSKSNKLQAYDDSGSIGRTQSDASWIDPALRVSSDAQFSLSILALRRAEAAQKWKEVALSVEEDYVSQIQAHWGDKPSNALSGMCTYLGGVSCNLDINAITNTNLADDNAALQRATGTFSSNGNINFDSNGQYGIIMCIFRALPIIDYTTSGVYFGCTLTDVTDFPIPEFDRIGMESVPVCRASNPVYDGSNPPFKPDLFLGYAPRYIDWKTAVDVSRGEFATKLESYVMKFNDSDLFAADSIDFPDNPNVEADSVKAGFFKVNPHIVDTLFAVDADKADQLLCSTFFDVKAVRSLDTNGLPY